MALRLIATALAVALAGAAPAAKGPPEIPCAADDCKSVGQLCAWKVLQMHQASFVPGPYRQYPMGAIGKSFMKRLGELENRTMPDGSPQQDLKDPCPVDPAALATMPKPPPCVYASGQPMAMMAQPMGMGAQPMAAQPAGPVAMAAAGPQSQMGLSQWMPSGFAGFLPGAGGAKAAPQQGTWQRPKPVAMDAAAGAAPGHAMSRQYLARMEVAKCATRLQQAWSGKAGAPEARLPVLLATADMCGGKPELKEWHVCQFAEIDVHVPRQYQELTAKALEKQYQRRLEQLEGVRDMQHLNEPQEVALPVILMGADQCPSIAELEAWRTAKMSEIRDIVPADFQPLAFGALDHAFRQRFSALDVEQSLVAEPPASHASGMAAVLMVFCGLMVPALISMVRSAGNRVASPRSRCDYEDEGFHGDYALQEAC